MQHGVGTFLLGKLPGLVLIDVFVDLVGQQHGLAQRLAELAFLVQLGNHRRVGAQGVEQAAAFNAQVPGQMAVKTLGQKASCARGDIDVFADQIAVDAGDEIGRVEVDVFDMAVQLGGDVVAQRLGVQPQLQVLQRVDAGAPALAHLVAAVDGQEAVNEDVVGRLAAAEMQHRRPEQRVEGDDVLANEVVLLQRQVGHIGGIVLAALV